MQWIVLDGVPPYDGRYELDIDANRLDTVEWGWIKRYSGYLPGNVDEGFAGADPELICALALIALSRAGKIQPRDAATVFGVLARAPVGDSIRTEDDTPDEPTVVDAGPPASSSNANGASSGAGSTTSSETSGSGPNATGIPASATSGSDPPTFMT